MNIYNYLSRRSRTFLTILGFLLVAIIGAIDLWTGTDISFSLFYLIPIALVTWFAGRECGVIVAAFGAVTWLLAELLWRLPDMFFAVLFWNTLVRLGFFLVVVYLETRVKGLSGELQGLLLEKTIEAGVKGILLDNVADSVILHDLNGKILYANDAAGKSRGYARADLLTQNVNDILPVAYAGLYKSRIKELLEKGELTFESSNYHRDGRIIPFEVHARVFDLDGKKVVLRVGRDIAERKRAEEILRRAKEFNESLVNTAQVIILTLDTDGRIVSFNPYMEEISGYRLNEVKGQEWFGIFLPERNRGRTKDLFKKAISNIQTKGNIDIIVTKDKRELCIEWFDKTLKNSEGKVLGLLSIGQDVTERKRMEKQLQESEEKYRILVENANETILVAQDGKFKYVNYKVIDLLGYLPEQLVGRPFIDYIHPEDRKMVAERHIRRLKGEDLPGIYPFRVINKAGQAKWVEINAVRIDWQGKPATLNFLVDITDRKQMESEVHQNEERYRSLFNESRDAIMTLSPEKGFLSGNAATIKLFACQDEKDFTSHSPATLSPEFQPDGAPSMDKAQKMMKIALENGSHFFEWTHRRADGTDFPATVLLSKLEHGGEANLQATVRDITEEERVKNELKSKIKELEEFFEATISRENKMAALEIEVNLLLRELGREPKYY